MIEVNRVQTGVRMEASLLKVPKGLAEYTHLGLGGLRAAAARTIAGGACRPNPRSNMQRMRTFISAVMSCAVAASSLALCACGKGTDNTRHTEAAGAGDAKVVNLYIWSDYLAPDTLSSFEKQSGIKVNVSYFDTNETLEARVLTGNSGFDVVVPTAPFMQRQIRSGAYLPLDKKALPNLVNMDPASMAKVALNDPGNEHGVIYAWGTYGVGYNIQKLASVLPNQPVNSWRLLFDPAYAAKLAPCGINFLDAPAGVVRLVLKYLGKDPNAPSTQDLAAAEAVLLKIRPYIRTIDTELAIEAIANGDICVALGYNGDFVQARNRAQEAKNGIQIGYAIPDEGSLLWFDMLAIPRDAPHVANALALVNYLMSPRAIADVSNATGFANGNAAATSLLNPALAADPIVYPPEDQRQRLFVQTEDPPERARAITRLWQKFKTGQ
jgi:putrescine transport system substrate-binding protein